MLRASRRVVPVFTRPRQQQQWRPLQSAHHRLLSTWDHKREKPPQAPRVTSFHRKEPGATDSTTTPLGGPFNTVQDAETIASSAGDSGGDASPVPLFEEALHPFHNNHSDLNFDVESNALRMGFPHYKNEYVDEPGDEIREEMREEATLMAERVLCRIRRTMGEREANKVLRKLSSYTSNPRPTRHSVTKFFGSLEIMNHADHANEFAYLRAFLCGKDAEKAAMDAASLLHPDHPMYDDACAVILVHCKRACATTLARLPNSTLPFVKRQLLRLLQAKGWSEMVSYAGLLHVPRDRNEALNPIDNEWVALTLEDDLAEFHRDLDDARDMLATIRRDGGLTNHDVEKLLSVMVAYVKMTKAHRDILQLLVCEFQNTVKPSLVDDSGRPRPSQDTWMAPIVDFLSSGRANLAEIQAEEGFDVDLVHHRHRTDAAIRLLLDARMRTSHIYIRGLDEEVLDRTLANKSDATRRALLTTALNLATVLDDRDFHAFYGRYVRHKLTWRSNFDTSVDIFLSDIAEGLPKQIPQASRQFLVDSLCQVHNDLTLEALNVCRLRVLNRGRLIRATATLTRVGEAPTAAEEDSEDTMRARTDLPESWDRRRTVFYHNLPPNTTVDTVRQTFENIGRIERIWMFDEPRAELSPVIEPPPSDDVEDATNDDGSPKKTKRKAKKEGKAKTKDGDSEEAESSDGEATDDGEDTAPTDDDDSPKKAKRESKKKTHAKTKDGPSQVALSNDDVAPGEKATKTLHVVASERHSTTQCVVEFATEDGQKRALHPALKIFGVMVKGAEELRATFSTAPDTRTVVTVHSIPFCTRISHVHRHLQAALGDDLQIDLGNSALPNLFVTKGTLELSFNSFEEAAVVVDRLNTYLAAMPDPKYELPFVAKKKQKYEPTTTKTFVTNPLTKTLRAKREKDKAEDQARNATPTVYLRYKDGVPEEDHRPFEVSWTPVPRRRPRPAL